MALSSTVKKMRTLLAAITVDLEKAEKNKAAAQRVRKHTLAFAKIAKEFRKESVAAGKKGATTKKAAPKRKAVAKKKAPARKTVAAKKKSAPKRKVAAKRAAPARKAAPKRSVASRKKRR